MQTFSILGVGLLLALSLGLNLFLYQKLKKKPPKEESYEVMDLLQDLLAGEAMVQVKRIDPASVLMRRRAK